MALAARIDRGALKRGCGKTAVSIVASPDATSLRPNETHDMSETHDTIDRLEARIDHQAARIDALYRALERHGIFPRPVNGSPGDASPDESWEVATVPSDRQAKRPPLRRPRRAPGFHLGDATGV